MMSADNMKWYKTFHQERVEKFMRLAGQNVPELPVINLDEKVRLLRAKLILEEALETINKGLGISFISFGVEVTIQTVTPKITGPFDIVEAIDGCGDLSVVTTGTLSAMGVPDVPFLQLIDHNNLDKFGPGHSFREDGKLIKPPGHQPPDIAGELMKFI